MDTDFSRQSTLDLLRSELRRKREELAALRDLVDEETTDAERRLLIHEIDVAQTDVAELASRVRHAECTVTHGFMSAVIPLHAPGIVDHAIGPALRHLRERARIDGDPLRQELVADRMGSTQSAISNLEGPSANPTAERVHRYVAACGHQVMQVALPARLWDRSHVALTTTLPYAAALARSYCDGLMPLESEDAAQYGRRCSTALSVFFDQVQSWLDAAQCVVYLFDPRDNRLKHVHHRGVRFDGPVRGPIATDGLPMRFLRDGSPVFVEDVHRHAAFRRSPFTTREGVASVLVVPFGNTATKLLGVVFMSFTDRRDPPAFPLPALQSEIQVSLEHLAASMPSASSLFWQRERHEAPSRDILNTAILEFLGSSFDERADTDPSFLQAALGTLASENSVARFSVFGRGRRARRQIRWREADTETALLLESLPEPASDAAQRLSRSSTQECEGTLAIACPAFSVCRSDTPSALLMITRNADEGFSSRLEYAIEEKAREVAAIDEFRECLHDASAGDATIDDMLGDFVFVEPPRGWSARMRKARTEQMARMIARAFDIPFVSIWRYDWRHRIWDESRSANHIDKSIAESINEASLVPQAGGVSEHLLAQIVGTRPVYAAEDVADEPRLRTITAAGTRRQKRLGGLLAMHIADALSVRARGLLWAGQSAPCPRKNLVSLARRMAPCVAFISTAWQLDEDLRVGDGTPYTEHVATCVSSPRSGAPQGA
ncbi:MAG: GAF domain-containing protein [Phycisphaerales bacterium]|nr:GAF domain-containing protein [Phycisphaerales bacterium]